MRPGFRTAPENVRSRGLSLVAALTGALIMSPCASAEPADEAARQTLKLHCARCHDAASLENPPAKGGLGDILDLSALAEREDLVVAGDPDASPLYQVMLGRHRPLSVFFGPVPGPGAGEIQAVRDWLSGLKPGASACEGRSLLTSQSLKADAEAWRKAFDTEPSRPLRFIGLDAVSNLCRSDSRLAAYREAVSGVLARLSKDGKAPPVDAVGEASALLAFRPADIGLEAAEWDALAASSGGLTEGIADAGALAARVQGCVPAAQARSGAVAAEGDAARLISGLEPEAALSGEWERRVTLRRAAAELGQRPEDLKAGLDRLEGPHRETGLRLAQAGLDRATWSILKAALSGSAAVPMAAGPATVTSLTLALWTDKLGYKTGDLLTVNARASAACYLTIVAVEADGLATVLFPNDAVTDNHIAGGTVVTVPHRDAKFQLRLDKPGRQGLTGICNARAKRPEGIGHDFERQRFTSLGDWRTFLASTAEREAAYQKTEAEMRKFRARRDGVPEPPAEQLPVGTEDEARAGLSFLVE